MEGKARVRMGWKKRSERGEATHHVMGHTSVIGKKEKINWTRFKRL